MIQEIRIRNFLSFKDEVTLSFEATKDKTYEDYQVVEVAPNVRLLKLALLYGANASGKSNLIKVFEFLRHFLLRNTTNKDDKTEATPFLLSHNTPNEPSELELIFFIEGKKYRYDLSLTQEKVCSEELFVYNSKQPTAIFNRKEGDDGTSDIKFNPSLKISQTVKETITLNCLRNMSVLAAYNAVNINIDVFEHVIRWIKNKFGMFIVDSETPISRFAEHLVAQHPEEKKYLLDFLKIADFNIVDIETEVVPDDIPGQFLSLVKAGLIELTEKEKIHLLKEKKINRVRSRFVHQVTNSDGSKDKFYLEKNQQSRGTLRLLGLAKFIHDTIENDGFIAIDEIESSLHPRLVEFIIDYFLKESNHAQLFITTHYDELLDEMDLIRKDCFWFLHKMDNGGTDLYPLSDFKGINRIASLQKAYKYFKFGATPNIE